MEIRTVTAEQTIEAEIELCFEVCFALLAHPPDPAELEEAGAPPPVVREAKIRREGHRVVEVDRPKRFVVDSVTGAVTTRIEMTFEETGSGTKARQIFSIRPEGWIARLLTVIPRRRLEQALPAMQDQLRYLKSRCEDRSFLLNAHRPSQEQQLRARAGELIAGAAYFRILLGSNVEAASAVANVPTILSEAARAHLTLASGERPEDSEIEEILDSEIYPEFERRLEAGDAASLSFFTRGFPYYLAWVNRLTGLDKDGLMSLDAIARGDREVMGKLMLESLGPPREEELRAIHEKMTFDPETLFLPLASWKRQRVEGGSASTAALPSSFGSEREPGARESSSRENDPDSREGPPKREPGESSAGADGVSSTIAGDRPPREGSARADGVSTGRIEKPVEISVSAPEEQVRELLRGALPRDFYESIDFRPLQIRNKNPFAGNVRGAPVPLRTLLIFSADAAGGGADPDLVEQAVLRLRERFGPENVEGGELRDESPNS